MQCLTRWSVGPLGLTPLVTMWRYVDSDDFLQESFVSVIFA